MLPAPSLHITLSGPEFFGCMIAGGETWVHHFRLTSRQLQRDGNTHNTTTLLPHKEKFKIMQSAGKGQLMSF
jgi:hypothetical protein